MTPKQYQEILKRDCDYTDSELPFELESIKECVFWQLRVNVGYDYDCYYSLFVLENKQKFMVVSSCSAGIDMMELIDIMAVEVVGDNPNEWGELWEGLTPYQIKSVIDLLVKAMGKLEGE